MCFGALLSSLGDETILDAQRFLDTEKATAGANKATALILYKTFQSSLLFPVLLTLGFKLPNNGNSWKFLEKTFLKIFYL